MSRAWSIGRTDRCKYKTIRYILKYKLNTANKYQFMLIYICNIIVKVTAEIKKNIFMQNVAPGSYSIQANKEKKSDPKWR